MKGTFMRNWKFAFYSFIFLIFGMPAFLHAQTVHLLTVADFRGFEEKALDGVKKDIENIEKFFEKNLPGVIKHTQVDGNMATPEAIREKINELEPEQNDTIVFYYSGHAANDSNNNGQFLQLKDKKGNPTALDRHKIKNWLLDKDCRLVVMLTDCCNMFEENEDLTQDQVPTMRGTSSHPFIQELFIKSSGLADITSSKVGQYSYALKNGSIFTNAMIKTITEMDKEMEDKRKKKKEIENDFNWKTLMERLSKRSNELFNNSFPNGSPQGQIAQDPYAYTLPQPSTPPDEPKPVFGVAVQSLSFGNVRVTEVVPKYPGAMLGIQYGDIITYINALEILDESDYSRAIDCVKDILAIKITRNNKELAGIINLKTSKILLGFDEQPSFQTDDFGIFMPEDTNVIANVKEDSLAAKALREGDEILSVNSKVISNAADYRKAFESAKKEEMKLKFIRLGMKYEVKFNLEKNEVIDKPVLYFGATMEKKKNIIKKIYKDSLAEKIGFKIGDAIFDINSLPIKNETDLDKALEAMANMKKPAVFRFYRKGKEWFVTCELGKGIFYDPIRFFGISLREESNIIENVDPNSLPEKAGLRTGDTIISINNAPIENKQNYLKIIEKMSGEMNIIFIRDDQKWSVEVDLETNKVLNDPTPLSGILFHEESNIIEYVAPNSLAEKAGLRTGDSIVLINEFPINDKQNYLQIMEDMSGELNITFIREGKKWSTKADLDKNEIIEPAKPLETWEPDPNGPVFGASMPTDKNTLVAIAPNSPAEHFGLQVNDQILKFNGKNIFNGKDFDVAVDESPRHAELLILRNGGLIKIKMILNKADSNSTQPAPAQQAPTAPAEPPVPTPDTPLPGAGTNAGIPQNPSTAVSTTAPALGVSLENSSNRIASITPDSPAENIGLEVGDQILKFNNINIRNFNDLSRAIAASGENASLQIVDHRKNEEHSLIIPLNK